MFLTVKKQINSHTIVLFWAKDEKIEFSIVLVFFPFTLVVTWRLVFKISMLFIDFLVVNVVSASKANTKMATVFSLHNNTCVQWLNIIVSFEVRNKPPHGERLYSLESYSMWFSMKLMQFPFGYKNVDQTDEVIQNMWLVHSSFVSVVLPEN